MPRRRSSIVVLQNNKLKSLRQRDLSWRFSAVERAVVVTESRPMSATDSSPSLELASRGNTLPRSESIHTAIALPGRRTDDSELLHLVDQRRSLHAQPFRSTVPATYDPFTCIKRSKDVISFHLLKTSEG